MNPGSSALEADALTTRPARRSSFSVPAPPWPSGEASDLRAADPGGDSQLSYTGDIKMGASVATLPDALHHRVRSRTGQPCVCIL